MKRRKLIVSAGALSSTSVLPRALAALGVVRRHKCMASAGRHGDDRQVRRMTMLAAGDPTPDFRLDDAAGRTFDVADARGKPLVVFFYPKDATPGCTAEACSFRDAYEDFVAAGAIVVGISSDDGASHARFAEKHRLPFRLLSDPGDAVRRAFGVPATWGLLPGRATFVIDAGGTIRYAFNSQFQPTVHASRALDVVRTLTQAAP